MKDLIYVTAYCPTEGQVIALERCIDSIVQCGKHIALISHSHIPLHIQKKCQYYVYDYNNDTTDDYNLLGYNFFSNQDFEIQSIFFNKYFYGFAIYRMNSIACQIAINFGYENIHHIEYDCELIDKSLIDENSKLLKEYDSVIYTNNGQKNGFLFGPFKSLRVSSLPEKFKNYDREFIEREMKVAKPKQLETLSKKLFMESGKVFFKKAPTSDEFKSGDRVFSRNLHYTLYYNQLDKTLNIFYQSIKNSSEEIIVIINENKIVKIQTKPQHWYVRSLGIFDDINSVRIDDSQKVIYEKKFDDHSKEILKLNSYLVNARNSSTRLY